MIANSYTLNVKRIEETLFEASILEMNRSVTGTTVKEAVKNVKNMLIEVLRDEVEAKEQIDMLETSMQTQKEVVEGLAELEKLEALKVEKDETFYWVTLHAEVEIKIKALTPKYAIEDSIRALDIATDSFQDKVDDVYEVEVIETQAILIAEA